MKPASPIYRTSKYEVQIRERDIGWYSIHITVHNHPEFSNKAQNLVLSVKGGGVKGKLDEITVYKWLSPYEWAMPDELLAQHLMTVL